MASVPLTAIGRGAITLAPPWSYRLFKLGMLAYPKGVTPPHLVKYLATGMNPNLEKALKRVRAMGTGRSRGKRRR